jgi:hypothetical protein
MKYGKHGEPREDEFFHFIPEEGAQRLLKSLFSPSPPMDARTALVRRQCLAGLGTKLQSCRAELKKRAPNWWPDAKKEEFPYFGMIMAIKDVPEQSIFPPAVSPFFDAQDRKILDAYRSLFIDPNTPGRAALPKEALGDTLDDFEAGVRKHRDAIGQAISGEQDKASPKTTDSENKCYTELRVLLKGIGEEK